MAGSPIRRKRKEEAAKQAIANNAVALEAQKVAPRSDYTLELKDEIAELIAAGTPLDDTKVGNDVAKLGVCSLVGVSARTIYRWQKKYPEFADAIQEARTESSHRLADRLNALAQVALDQPGLANAVRVAGDLYKWGAAVRNPETYGERKRVELSTTPDLADRLRRARERDVETDKPEQAAIEQSASLH